MIAAAMVAMLGTTGCISTYLNDETKGADGMTAKEVTFYRGGFVTATQFDNAEINYQGVTAKIGNYSNKGDAEMGDVITAGIIGGITAYGTMGVSAVGSGVVNGIAKWRKAQATNEVQAVESPPVKPVSRVAPPPIVSAADAVSGKYAVVVIGDRSKCGLCRALWQQGFETDVEKASPNVDVVDADLRDGKALYDKYRPKGSFVYPLAQVFGVDGKLLGSFVARGLTVQGFCAKVAEICPECSVK
jgi:hypothetical protein